MLRDPHRVQLMPLHSDRECLHPSQEQEAVERRGDGPNRILVELRLRVDLLVRCHDRSSEHIAVPTEILCCTVNYDVRTELKRILKVRTHERVVDDRDYLMPRCDLRDGPDVADFQERVGGGLKPDHLRPTTYSSIDISRLPRVNVGELEPEVGESLTEEPPRTTVE